MNTSKQMKTVALLGNPNVGKTTLFNRLTGLRHTTANYPGVTVEKVSGLLKVKDTPEAVSILDLPGTYSLYPQSMDEEIVRNVLMGNQEGTPKPDLLVMVLDANNLERNLYLALQVMDLGIPMVFTLNMWDQAEECMKKIDIKKMEELLKYPCTTTTAHHGSGIETLKKLIVSELHAEHEDLEGFGFERMNIEERYRCIEGVIKQVVCQPEKPVITISDRIDSVLTHPFFGWVVFIGLMSLIFQSIFTWASPLMDMISACVTWLGSAAANILPDGQLESLIVDGVIAGVGNVIVFLPQIFLLFFFIALFEDFGYMARAAFVLDLVMKKVGLNGRAFLPLLSSFACAIPGIMATRTIKERQDRLATILVAPLMSCSARLPVYALMIGAFIPQKQVLGIFDLKGITLLSMYLLSIFAGLGMAALFRKTLLRGRQTPFLMELPPYRIPRMKTVLIVMWDRGKEFLFNAGKIIFWISIVLWFAVSYPKNESIQQKYDLLKQQAQQTVQGETLDREIMRIQNESRSEQVKSSFAGRIGVWMEPVIKPLGFDWKIGIGLVSSFAAREVLVSTLAIIHNVGEDADETSTDLIQALQNERDPITGKPLYTPLTAISLMVFFVLACQCMSTIAIAKKETGGWGWPVFMVVYMTALAWIGSFAVYQTGLLMGFG